MTASIASATIISRRLRSTDLSFARVTLPENGGLKRMNLTLSFCYAPEHTMNITPEVYDITRQEYYMDVDETLPVTIGYCDPEKPDVPCILFEPPFHYIERNTGKVYTLSFEIVTRGSGTSRFATAVMTTTRGVSCATST
jgi:hypothetical protein